MEHDGNINNRKIDGVNSDASFSSDNNNLLEQRIPAEQYEGKIAGMYDLEKTLGSGHFAVVKLARHVFTGEKVAVKVIDKTKLDEISRAHLFQEVRCMKLVQHPHVVRLYEVIDTQTKLYLILELGDGGDLYDYIMRHEGGLSEPLACDYFRQIVQAIAYCHQLHVVHRDLKPENVVFFEKQGTVKLTDFGFSNRFYPGQKLQTSCGSLEYMAPEILLGDSYDAPAVDVWSLGVILYMLVCGRSPFQERNDSETLTKIMDCKYSMPCHVSNECSELIGKMLVVAPEERFSLQQIGEHPWMQQLQDAASDVAAASLETKVPITAEQNDKDAVCRARTVDRHQMVPQLCLPLVSSKRMTDDDRNDIFSTMVNGNIASRDEITEALDRNEYNHITATYYLLAEGKLRNRNKQEVARKTSRKLNPIRQPHLSAADQKPMSQLLHVLEADNAQMVRIRKCSIVQEEDDDLNEKENATGNDDVHEVNMDGFPKRLGSRSEVFLNNSFADNVISEDPGCSTLEANPMAAAECLKTAPCDMSSSTQTRNIDAKLSATRISTSVQPNVNNDAGVSTTTYTQQTIADESESSVRSVEVTPSSSFLPTSEVKDDCVEEDLKIGSCTQRNSNQTSLNFHPEASLGTPINYSHASGTPSNVVCKFNVTNVRELKTESRSSMDDGCDSQSSLIGVCSSACVFALAGVGITSQPPVNDNNPNVNSSSAQGCIQARNEPGGSEFRHHRANHRHHRSCETRLRESQSLNRISEVQESEQVMHDAVKPHAESHAESVIGRSMALPNCHLSTSGSIGSTNDDVHSDSKYQHHNRGELRSKLFRKFRKSIESAPTNHTDASVQYEPIMCCSAAIEPTADADASDLSEVPTTVHAGAEDQPTLPNTEAAGSVVGGGTSVISKKLKILGRYFQVNSLLSNNMKF